MKLMPLCFAVALSAGLSAQVAPSAPAAPAQNGGAPSAPGGTATAPGGSATTPTQAPSPAAPAPAGSPQGTPATPVQPSLPTPPPVPTISPIATGPAKPVVSPEQHLSDAETTLANLSEKTVSDTVTRKNVSQLKKDFATLKGAYKGFAGPVAPWQTAIYDVERDLVLLIGGGGPEAESDSTKPVPGLAEEVGDASTRDVLKLFRTQVELFYDAASSQPPGPLQSLAPPVN